MADIHNVFISHYSENDDELHRLKQSLTEKGCTVRNSSVDAKKFATILNKLFKAKSDEANT